MRDQLEQEIERLERRLDNPAVIDELATVRRGLACQDRVELADVRIASPCTQRWDDMVGDDRVRACAGCDRPVFNLSEMTRVDAEAVLATRGLTPCVRFYRRLDGTLVTADCVNPARPVRRLAVIASSLAFGSGTALADPPAEPEAITIDQNYTMGIPIPTRQPVEIVTVHTGALVEISTKKRPAIEWSVWGRLGMSIASQTSDRGVAQRVIGPAMDESTSRWEAAVLADATFGVARDGDLRLGAWIEARTSSRPVAGGELVIGGLTHPYETRMIGTTSLVLRAGANASLVTGALGVGYVGRWRADGWGTWARHVFGARAVLTATRALDEPRDWSVTVGLEVEPIGMVRGLVRKARGR